MHQRMPNFVAHCESEPVTGRAAPNKKDRGLSGNNLADGIYKLRPEIHFSDDATGAFDDRDHIPDRTVRDFPESAGLLCDLFGAPELIHVHSMKFRRRFDVHAVEKPINLQSKDPQLCMNCL